jgi:hypothetical protein
MDSSYTPPKHEKEDDESSIDILMFDTENDKSSSVDLKMFDTENFMSSNLHDCYHHIEKVSTSIQMFSIFIISLIITDYTIQIHDQIRLLEEMLAKAKKDNKILTQLINHHKKTMEAAKNKVSRDVQILNLFITSLIITN